MQNRFALALGVVLVGVAGAQAPDAATFERHAMEQGGDAGRGREVFHAGASLCSTCHSVDGSASKVGPDLGAIGDKFEKRDLIRAVLEPGATVAVGYGATAIQTKQGETRSGVVKSATAEGIDLMGVDGRVTRIATAEIASNKTDDISLMPPGLCGTMGVEGFTDLVAYLQSLRATPPNELPGSPERIPLAVGQATFEPLFGPFDHPTWLGWIPGQSTKAALVLEHAGRIWHVEQRDGKEQRRPFLDISRIVRRGGATGLLGMDFHPGFERNRRYVVKYQVVENGVISTVIDERKMKPDAIEDSGEAPRQIIKIRSVTQDHNGGSIGFGPDGFLYFGMGDTGPQRDPQGHGQDMGMLLGKLMRIDIDRTEGDLGYAIPQDNPFRSVEGVRPEIWASGFREPYRLSWDPVTKDLWVGDVGQDRIEEVAIVRRGENHGWNVYEGHHPFSERFRRTGEVYVPPVMSYSHRHGVSVTGGEVYRGKKAPKLEGWYIFADHESRRVWALTQTDRKLGQVVEIARAPSRVTAITRDGEGELQVVGFNDGMIQRLKLESVDPRPLETRVIAETSERTPVSWRFTEAPPSEGWQFNEFDPSGWNLAPGGFGSNGTPGGNIRTQWRSGDLWVRREFDVAPEVASAAGNLILRLHHDEDVEVYLNGNEVYRRNGWTQSYVDEPLAGVSLKAGRNVIAVHCHQNGGGQYLDAGLLKTVTPGS